MNKNSSNQPMMAGFEPNQPLMPVQNAQVAIKKVVPIMDPRTVPVVQVDNGLPAVAPAYLNAGHLRQAFGSSLDWQPELRDEHRWTSKPPAKAAVLVALVQRQEINVLLTQRSAGLSNHSGQIAFPGGRQDPEDHNANDTALREAWEEVGLESRFVEVLGVLPQYVTGTSFIISPVVALVQPGFELRPNPHEVADIFEVPLAFLLNPAHHQRHAFEWQGMRREWFSMPYRVGNKDHYIWGATAGMLRNFYRFMQA